MRLRSVLGAAAGSVGAVALANRSLRRDPEEIGTPLGYPPESYRWRGFEVAYTEAGDPEDPDLVLFHGVNAAGSSHEFQNVIDELAAEYHVLAPDLPGFGHSDRPPLLYSASLYRSFVGEFLADLAENPTVVASSLSAAYVAEAAAERDLGLAELVLVCPTATTIPGQRTWLRSLVRAPLVGEAVFNLLTSRRSIRYFLADHGFADAESVTDEWVEYDHATTHQPGSRFAPASFVSGFLDSDVDLGPTLASLGVPVRVVWGASAELPPVETGEELAEAAGATFHVVEAADLLPHAERPERFLAAAFGTTEPAGDPADGTGEADDTGPEAEASG
jgi:pimeloyl-ACP methyl ester carboxylesterase